MKPVVEAHLAAIKKDTMKKERSASPGISRAAKLGKQLSLKVDMNKSIS